VKILLDTHFLLWWLADDPDLGEQAATWSRRRRT
jgi:PIN domain nuclease of toxin-antitoxin system